MKREMIGEKAKLIKTRASLVAQMVKNLPARQEPGFNPWVRNTSWRRKWQPTPVLLRTPWTEDRGGLRSMEPKSWTRLSDFHFQCRSRGGIKG